MVSIVPNHGGMNNEPCRKSATADRGCIQLSADEVVFVVCAVARVVTFRSSVLSRSILARRSFSVREREFKNPNLAEIKASTHVPKLLDLQTVFPLRPYLEALVIKVFMR